MHRDGSMGIDRAVNFTITVLLGMHSRMETAANAGQQFHEQPPAPGKLTGETTRVPVAAQQTTVSVTLHITLLTTTLRHPSHYSSVTMSATQFIYSRVHGYSSAIKHAFKPGNQFGVSRRSMTSRLLVIRFLFSYIS